MSPADSWHAYDSGTPLRHPDLLYLPYIIRCRSDNFLPSRIVRPLIHSVELVRPSCLGVHSFVRSADAIAFILHVNRSKRSLFRVVGHRRQVALIVHETHVRTVLVKRVGYTVVDCERGVRLVVRADLHRVLRKVSLALASLHKVRLHLVLVEHPECMSRNAYQVMLLIIIPGIVVHDEGGTSHVDKQILVRLVHDRETDRSVHAPQVVADPYVVVLINHVLLLHLHSVGAHLVDLIISLSGACRHTCQYSNRGNCFCDDCVHNVLLLNFIVCIFPYIMRNEIY